MRRPFAGEHWLSLADLHAGHRRRTRGEYLPAMRRREFHGFAGVVGRHRRPRSRRRSIPWMRNARAGLDAADIGEASGNVQAIAAPARPLVENHEGRPAKRQCQRDQRAETELCVRETVETWGTSACDGPWVAKAFSYTGAARIRAKHLRTTRGVAFARRRANAKAKGRMKTARQIRCTNSPPHPHHATNLCPGVNLPRKTRDFDHLRQDSLHARHVFRLGRIKPAVRQSGERPTHCKIYSCRL